jgi:hypothetical protein
VGIVLVGDADAAVKLDVGVGIGQRRLVGELLGGVEMDAASARPSRSRPRRSTAGACRLTAQGHVRAGVTHGLHAPILRPKVSRTLAYR